MSCPYCNGQSLESFSGDRFTCYHGDAQSALGLIEPASVDAIISDPPYGSGANTMAQRLRSSGGKYRNTGSAPLPDIAGDSMLPEAWARMIHGVLVECKRIAKPGADLLWFCDWRSMPSMVEQVGAVGFHVRSVLVWDKGRATRPNRNGFRNQTELILWAKQSGKRERKTDVYLDGVFRHNTMSGSGKQHQTQKPIALMEELMRIAPPSSHVVDPFQGSGTTGVAAIAAGHTYTGVEAVPEYHKVAVDRLTETVQAESLAA